MFNCLRLLIMKEFGMNYPEKCRRSIHGPCMWLLKLFVDVWKSIARCPKQSGPQIMN